MSQKQKPNLAAALANVSGSTRRRNVAPLTSTAPAMREKRVSPAEQPGEKGREAAAPEEQNSYKQPSRVGTVPITAHFPKQVRDQLKILAIEQGYPTMHDLIAEAYNDVFAKYGRPEIVPRQPQGQE